MLGSGAAKAECVVVCKGRGGAGGGGNASLGTSDFIAPAPPKRALPS